MRFYYGWVIVAVSFLVMVGANGVAYTFGVFLVPISEDLGMSRSQASLAFALFMAVLGLCSPLVGRLIDRWGSRRVVVAGLVILLLGALAMSRVSAPLHLFLAFSLLVGVGYGCLTVLTLSVVISGWFQRRRGLAMGIAIAGLPTGPLVFSPIAAWLIQDFGWQNAYLAVAAIIGATVLPLAAWLLRDRPDSLPEDELAGSGQPAGPLWTVREAMGRPNFRRLTASYFGCGFTMALVQAHFPAHALHVHMAPITAAAVFGLMGVWAIPGTVAAGFFSDRLGRRALLATVYATRMCALALLAWAPGPPALVAGSILFGVSWTATSPLTSMLTGELFGTRCLGLLFGTALLIHQTGATLGAYLGGALYDVSGSYQMAYAIGAVVLAGAAWMSGSIAERPEPALAARA